MGWVQEARYDAKLFLSTRSTLLQAWLQFNKFTLMLKITTREALLKTILMLRFVGSEIYSDF